jgi:hypothetical protein
VSVTAALAQRTRIARWKPCEFNPYDCDVRVWKRDFSPLQRGFQAEFHAVSFLQRSVKALQGVAEPLPRVAGVFPCAAKALQRVVEPLQHAVKALQRTVEAFRPSVKPQPCAERVLRRFGIAQLLFAGSAGIPARLEREARKRVRAKVQG